MSSASTPVPSGQTPAEQANFVHVARPFKNPDYAAKATNRRTRSLKQIVTMERDAAMGIETSVGKKKTKKAGVFGKQRMRKEDASSTPALMDSGTATPADTEQLQEEGDLTMGSVQDGTGETSTADAAASALASSATLDKKRKDVPTYMSFEAPPSLRPRKKFCDVTGLLAPYTDPKSGLRYHSVEIYGIIKSFGPGVDQAYLGLRGDSSQIK